MALDSRLWRTRHHGSVRGIPWPEKGRVPSAAPEASMAKIVRARGCFAGFSWGFSWDFYGICMVCLWDFIWDIYGILYGLFCGFLLSFVGFFVFFQKFRGIASVFWNSSSMSADLRILISLWCGDGSPTKHHVRWQYGNFQLTQIHGRFATQLCWENIANLKDYTAIVFSTVA